MKNYRKIYLKKIEQAKKMNKDDLYVQIKFTQHERLVHLLVTIAFSFLLFFSLIFLLLNVSMLKALLVLILTIMVFSYVIYYFYLENLVQKLYEIYEEKKR